MPISLAFLAQPCQLGRRGHCHRTPTRKVASVRCVQRQLHAGDGTVRLHGPRTIGAPGPTNLLFRKPYRRRPRSPLPLFRGLCLVVGFRVQAQARLSGVLLLQPPCWPALLWIQVSLLVFSTRALSVLRLSISPSRLGLHVPQPLRKFFAPL